MNPLQNNADNDESALLSIEHELYDPRSKQGKAEFHHVKSHRSLALPSSWGDEAPLIIKQKLDTGMSFGTKLLLVSTILLFVAVGFSLWRVISLRNVVSASNIDMTASITPYIEGGEATPLVLTLHNRNLAKLESASVTLLYKQGNGSQDEQEKIQEKRELGTINSDEYKKQDFNVTLYGSESESRDLVVKLEYKVLGSNAIFTKLATAQVILRTPPISVNIDGPSVLSIGQSGTYSFIVKNNSATTSIPSVLRLQLPNSFTVESSNPKPIALSNSWNIQKLNKGESQTISVTGSFTGKQDESATLSAKIGSVGDSSTEIGIVYSAATTDVKLQSSPLEVVMNLSTSAGVGEVLGYGDKATLVLTYTNRGTEALQDVTIKLALSGDAAQYAAIDPGTGYYDSVAKTITWNKAAIPDLAVLAPNSQEGNLRVVIPIVLKGNNSPSLKAVLTGSASSRASNDVVSTVSKTFSVSGSATLAASTQYKTSPFTNTGPIPPRPNQDTTYTVELKVSAQNALSTAHVSFVLPTYVSWRGVTSDPAITYDSKTRTVSWNTGHVDQGKIVIADIGLSVKPSQSHVGISPTITSGIVLEAEEEVSRVHLRMTLSPLTTSVKNEVWPENPSIVVDRK
jgi:hypothetical protein